MVASEERSAGYEPNYRQQDVDETLENHEIRISRLEKAGLVVLGYGVAEGSQIIDAVSSLIL